MPRLGRRGLIVAAGTMSRLSFLLCRVDAIFLPLPVLLG